MMIESVGLRIIHFFMILKYENQYIFDVRIQLIPFN